ncbi:MAG: hypothetical protein ACTHKR_00460 [Sphingomonas sp.]
MSLLYVAGFWILLIALCGTALWLGGKPEKMVALAYLAAAAATLIVRSPAVHRYAGVEIGVLAVDVLLLGGLIWVSIEGDRWWTIFAAAFQAISTLAHLARIVDPTFSRLAYSLMEGASSYPALIALGIGTWRHATRPKISGT